MDARTDRRLPLASPLKRRLSKLSTVRLVNPLLRRLIELDAWPHTQAILETVGRKSGRPRRVPVGNGLRGDVFWIVTEHGWSADYVKNIRREPRVRVKAGGRWRTGTARILEDDNPRERLRRLGRPVNDALLRLVGTEMLTIRVDLED